MHSPIAYLNGRFQSLAESALPLHDAGFASGATVVDNARTFHGKLFRWEDHLARFRRDCEACCIPLDVSDEVLSSIATELIARNLELLTPGSELQLATFATPGPLGFYFGSNSNGPATLGMVAYPIPLARYGHFFEDGVSLAIAGYQSSDSEDLLPANVKHRSRLLWHIAQRTIDDRERASYSPGSVAVVLNRSGIGDTAIGSVLGVAGEEVICPLPGSALESISVRVVCELCRDLGIGCTTAPVDLPALLCGGEPLATDATSPGVTELLLAGTGFCIAGVRRLSLGSQARDFKWPGPVYRKLLTAWNDRVGLDIAAQFSVESGR